MKTTLLAAALAGSLIANLGLLALVLRSDAGTATLNPPATTSAPEGVPAGAPGVRPSAPDVVVTKRKPDGSTDLLEPAPGGTAVRTSARSRDILRRLRAEGVPTSAQIQVALALVGAELRDERRAVTATQSNAVWAARRSGSERNLSPEQREKLLELDLKQDDMLQELLGFDYRQEMAKERYTSNPQFAGLPLEKLLKVSELEHEQSMIARDQMRSAATPRERLAQLNPRTREAETNASLAQIFTPDELARYQLYNSQLATDLQNRLEGLSVTDAQYAAIYTEAAKAGTLTINPSPDNPMAIMNRHEPMIAAVRTQGSPDLALEVVTRVDQQFSPAIAILRQAGLTSDDILNRRELILGMRFNSNREQVTESYAQLTAGLSPEVIAKLDEVSSFQQARRRATLPRPRN